MTDKQDQSKHPFLSAVLGAVQPVNILTEYFSCFRGYKKTKAYILSYLDNWIYLKLKQGKPPWVYVVCQQIADSIGCCRDTVQKNLKELCNMGILKRLPYKRWATDNIWQYTINCDHLINHLFSSFTRAISCIGALAFEWRKLLSIEIENQTAGCQKSDSRMSEIRQPDVGNSASSTSSSSDIQNPSTNNDLVEEKKEDAIAQSPFIQDEETRDEEALDEKTRDEEAFDEEILVRSNNGQIKYSSPKLSAILCRLRLLRIPTTEIVENWVKKTPLSQIASNILALEELASEKGLKKPLAAFFAAVKDNWQPKNNRQSWWTAAATALGKDRRDKLISHVIELNGVMTVCFANGALLPFDEASSMDWEAIADFGGEV